MATGLLGSGLHIKGELHGEDDLIIEGTVEGTIKMATNLTLERGGHIKANIETENVIIRGVLEGNIVAREKISLRAGGMVIGDMNAPRIEIEIGAMFNGHIDVTKPARS